MKFPGYGDRPKLQVIDPETHRRQQGQLVEQAITAAESGQHVHYEGGGTVWCNEETPCAATRPISELLA